VTAPGRAYTALSDGAADYAVAFDTENGEELWRQRLGTTHEGAARGPEGSPVLADGRLFVLATSCSLHALSAADGRSIWQLDLGRELGAGERSRGCQSSPAVLGEILVVANAGDEHRAIALETATGKLLWSNSEIDPPRYNTPVVAQLYGEPQILVQGWASGEEGEHRSTLYSLDPATGRTLWSFGTVGDWSYQPPTPVADDAILYHTWNHARLLRVARQSDGNWRATPVWQSEGFDSVAVRNDLVFGAGLRDLVCLRATDGTVLWREPLGQTRLSLFGEVIAVVAVEAPTVRLIAASGDGYRELAAQGVFSAGAVNATPASPAGATLLVRNQEVLVALRWP
jgi:outer membrane protein assembly factor BamB